MLNVSIILTVFNGEKFVSETINSVLNQTFKDFELIIINDSSTDKSENIILSFDDNRIIYIKNNSNLNIVRSRNIGIEKATGKYICFLDHDDILIEDKLEKQIHFLENNLEYGLVGCNIINIDQNNNIIGSTIVPENDNEIRNRLLRSSQFACGAVMVRKLTLEKVGLLDNAYIKTDDYDLWLRTGRISKMYNLQESLFKYRCHSNNTSKKSHLDMSYKSLKLCFKYRKYYPNFLISFILWIFYIIIPQKFSNKILKIIK